MKKVHMAWTGVALSSPVAFLYCTDRVVWGHSFVFRWNRVTCLKCLARRKGKGRKR